MINKMESTENRTDQLIKECLYDLGVKHDLTLRDKKNVHVREYR